jgi:multiple sugar transport system substrate-binding protein/sn-glycerol 3-phosphate transport system substrate-binding protein
MVDSIDLTGRNVQVFLWHQRPQQEQDLLQSMLDEFNKSNLYGIRAQAEIAGVTYNDVYNKVNAATQAGRPPEISIAFPNQAAVYRADGAVIDLTPFMQSKKYGLSEADMKDFFPVFAQADPNPQFQGERLGFPSQRSAQVMYYNVDWLKQLGYGEPPKDWKTWEEIACKASDPANGKAGWAFRHEPSDFASQVFARGGLILARDASAYVYNGPAGVESISLIQRLFRNKCAAEVPYGERSGERDRFANGQVLFVFGSSDQMPIYQQAVNAGGKFKWDIALLPYSNTPALNLYGPSLSIYKTTPERELASWLVIKYLSDKAQTTRWAIGTGFLPLRQSAKAEVIAAYKADPNWGPAADAYAKIFDWAPYGVTEPPVAAYDLVRTSIDRDVMLKVVTDYQVDPKMLLDASVSKANDILKANRPR